MGEKVAITARQAQTTRTSLQGVLTFPDVQIVFVDTPGIHKSNTLFNKRMMESVRGALADRDIILFLADATKQITEEDEQAVSALRPGVKALLIATKIDRLTSKSLLLPFLERYSKLFPFAESIPISAHAGEGFDTLKNVVTRYLPEGPALFPEDYLTDQPMRFMAGEIIREQILRTTANEVPHATAVLIDEWSETPKLIRIGASIHVERDGQKAILIGNKGETLKKIGSAARLELEGMLQRKVFLSLFVKVKPHWRKDPEFLTSIDWRSMVGSEDR